MNLAISLNSVEVSGGVRLLRDATADFDTSVARKNPDASGTGLAAPLLQTALCTVAEVGLHLVFELDTLADAAEGGAADLATYEAQATDVIRSLEAGIP